MNITILNYQMGNLHSVYKKLLQFDCKLVVSESPKDIQSADKIILPGVGHFGKAISNLNEMGYWDILNEKVLIKQTPILGICLGMQIMTKYSTEGNTKGLAWFNANVKKFKVNDKLRYKVPHTGWNSVEFHQNHPIISGLGNKEDFYFVHSFHVAESENNDVLGKTNYEENFVSALAKDHIMGMQFHPEKSHEVGHQIFENFIKL